MFDVQCWMFDVQPPTPHRPPFSHPPLHRRCSPFSSQPPLPLHRRRRRLLVRHHGPQLSAHSLARTLGCPCAIHGPLAQYSTPLLLPPSSPHAPHHRLQLQNLRRRRLANPPPGRHVHHRQHPFVVFPIKAIQPHRRPLCRGHLCLPSDDPLLRRPAGISQSPIRLPPSAE